MQLWLVTYEVDSDIGTIGIYSTREKAEEASIEFMKLNRYVHETRIQNLDLDDMSWKE
jgi:hypothetical protein